MEVDGVRVKYSPRKEDLDKCFEMGRKMGQAIKAAEPVSAKR